MDTERLQAFVTVAARQGISAAAREMAVSQSTMSRMVQDLEEELGVPLLERRRRPVGLTAAGEDLLRYAQQVLGGWEDLRLRLQAHVQGVHGPLRVAASTTPGEFIVPGLLAEFLRRHPGVEPRVDIKDTQAVVEEVQARRYDVGFIGSRWTNSNLWLVKVGEDEVVLAAPASHPLAQRSSVQPRELEGESLILRETGSGTYRILKDRLAEQGLSLPPHRVVMVLGSTQAVVTTVRAGLGVGFVSSLALLEEGTGRVRGVRLEGVDLRRPLYLAYEESRLGSPLVRAFVAFARERAEDNHRAVQP